MIYTIRRYRHTDIPAMVTMVQQFLLHQIGDQTNYFADIDFDERKVYDLLRSNVHNPDFFCNVVLDDADIVVGGMAGQIVEFIFSRDKVAKDLILFMSPEIRSPKLVIRLVKTYVTWAQKLGAREVQFSNSTGFKQEAFGALAKMLKFQQFEIGFSRRFS